MSDLQICELCILCFSWFPSNGPVNVMNIFVVLQRKLQSPCLLLPLSPNHSIFLTSRLRSVILTLSLSPLLFSNLVSIRMLNLGRNDTYGVTRGKNGRNWLRGRDRESGSSLQIRSTDSAKRWALLHSYTVNDVWEYLLSTLQHQGHSIWIGKNSISNSYMHENTIALTHTHTRFHMGIHAYTVINIWWHLEYQLL